MKAPLSSPSHVASTSSPSRYASDSDSDSDSDSESSKSCCCSLFSSLCCVFSKSRVEPSPDDDALLRESGGEDPRSPLSCSSPLSTSSSTYVPPPERPLPSVSVQRQPRLFALNSSSTQDGYPPPFFKRLDAFIHENGFRARDVFLAIDHNNNKAVSYSEIVTGLDRIDFHITKKEKKMLEDWMTIVVGHDLSFKEFTLALKQRASLTAPQRISVLKLAK